MKIAVILSDATAMMHTGADLDRTVRVFDMPPEMAKFIESRAPQSYVTVAFAIVEEPQE